MAHVIHVADADWNKRPRNAVGVGAARSSAVVCCGCISRPEVVPNEGHSIPLLSAHLVWVSSCTPHAADTHHRHNSHPQQMSSHSLSARQSHGAVGAKAEPTRLSVRTRYSPHSHARLGDPRSHSGDCLIRLTCSIPSVRDNFHYIVLHVPSIWTTTREDGVGNCSRGGRGDQYNCWSVAHCLSSRVVLGRQNTRSRTMSLRRRCATQSTADQCCMSCTRIYDVCMCIKCKAHRRPSSCLGGSITPVSPSPFRRRLWSFRTTPIPATANTSAHSKPAHARTHPHMQQTQSLQWALIFRRLAKCLMALAHSRTSAFTLACAPRAARPLGLFMFLCTRSCAVLLWCRLARHGKRTPPVTQLGRMFIHPTP
jgi:hypothetical protein